MKILTLNANLKGVGTFRRCYYYSRELARRGHNVTMVTVSRSSAYAARVTYRRDPLTEADEPFGPGPWIRLVEGAALGYRWLPGWGSGPLDIFWRIKELLASRYDVLYGFEYQPNVSWPYYLTRPFRSYRFCSDWCDWYAGESNWFRGNRFAQKVDSFLEERIRPGADKVTVTSRELYRRAERLGIPGNRIVQIPEGVDTEYLHDIDRARARQRLGVPHDRPVVVGVNEGDMARSVRIFHRVLQQNSNALYVIVGNASPAAQAEAARLGIAGNLHWAGWVADADYPRYLACADVMFLPLRDSLGNRARFPAKLLDYLACGRPIVTNPVGEVASLFDSLEIGVAAGQEDEEIAEAVSSLLRNREAATQMGKNGRRLMVEEWDWRLRGNSIAEVVCEPN